MILRKEELLLDPEQRYARIITLYYMAMEHRPLYACLKLLYTQAGLGDSISICLLFFSFFFCPHRTRRWTKRPFRQLPHTLEACGIGERLGWNFGTRIPCASEDKNGGNGSFLCATNDGDSMGERSPNAVGAVPAHPPAVHAAALAEADVPRHHLQRVRPLLGAQRQQTAPARTPQGIPTQLRSLNVVVVDDAVGRVETPSRPTTPSNRNKKKKPTFNPFNHSRFRVL